MNFYRVPNSYERGNVVALTLLGLAFAIIAGVVVLYLVGKDAPAPIPIVAPPVESLTDSAGASTPDSRSGWQTYTDDEYLFSLKFPPGWVVVKGFDGLDPVITVAPGVSESVDDSVYHESLTRISIYPRGRAGVGVFEQEEQSTVIVPVPRASAKDYRLENKRPWGTIVRFEQFPESWNEFGYVFARAAVEDEALTYLRGDALISEEVFDPFMGDRAVRSGYVDPAVRTAQELVLTSFQFVWEEDVDVANAEPNNIEVDTPTKGDVVSSPLTVRGRARGGWYFEASFPVRIETDAGEILAEVPASAEGEWMTQEFVPFELSVAFSNTSATSGVLVLEKSNPSGLPEHADEVRIPLVFIAE